MFEAKQHACSSCSYAEIEDVTDKAYFVKCMLWSGHVRNARTILVRIRYSELRLGSQVAIRVPVEIVITGCGRVWSPGRYEFHIVVLQREH